MHAIVAVSLPDVSITSHRDRKTLLHSRCKTGHGSRHALACPSSRSARGHRSLDGIVGVRDRRAGVGGQARERRHQRRAGEGVDGVSGDGDDDRGLFDLVAQAFGGQRQRVALQDEQGDEEDAVPCRAEDGLSELAKARRMSEKWATHHVVGDAKRRDCRAQRGECAGGGAARAGLRHDNAVGP